MPCPRCQHETRSGAKFCEECGTPLTAANPSGLHAPSYEEVTSALSEAVDQQTATAEILRVISRTPADIQLVLDTVAESAARLCESFDADIWRRDGDRLVLVAHHGQIPAGPIGEFILSLDRGTAGGRSVVDRRTVQVADAQAAAEEFPESSENAWRLGFRTILSVPLMREGVALGAIILRRIEVQLFTERQIALLQTFADQAVIAIENVRLFTELQEKNRALTEAHAQVTEALEQQTATGDILRVISSSPTDAQPVFDAILRSAVTLCNSLLGNVVRVDGDLVRLVATLHPRPEEVAAIYPAPLTAPLPPCRAIRENTVVHVPDVEAAGAIPPAGLQVTRAAGIRSLLVVPMRRDEQPIGAILIARPAVGPFPDEQIALLQTFADQAVIAIENVRLFTELQASNRELTTSLDTQTATSDILRVISQSTTDVQPVFDVIVENACRLCDGVFANAVRFDGALMYNMAQYGFSPEAREMLLRAFPTASLARSMSGRAILNRAVVQSEDMSTDVETTISHQLSRLMGFRAQVSVPMLRDGVPVGAITVARRERGPFPERQVDLLKTFADQAVIAIENVRLFKELEERTAKLTRSVDELRALGEVGQAISSTLDLQTVLSTIVARATQLAAADAGVIYEYDEPREVFEPRATERLEDDIVQTLVATPVRKGEGATGRLAEVHEPSQLADLRALGEQIPVRDILIRAGYRALLAVPLVREDHLIGGLTVFRRTPGEFAAEIVELLKTFATQSALALQNARLFREIEDKSRQLAAASQHKSEFLANMSHELRTPLNAIIGFSEVLTDRMFGELNEKQEEYLKDIYASGTHLLSLINDILDLSKIEAGRMELELTDFHLPTALDNALTLVRERVGRRSIALHTSIDNRLGEIQGDERKIRQVVLNLLSNAIKFTPEGGRIEVGAVPKDRFVEVSVSDTGVGIASEDQEAVFEEFRQVGTSAAKQEGTGLGLTLSRKFIELHGGRIWVKSQVGVGSTFTFTIPVRRGE